jgi:hypothetical protein
MTEYSLLCLEMQHEPRVADFVELFAQILGRLLYAYYLYPLLEGSGCSQCVVVMAGSLVCHCYS